MRHVLCLCERYKNTVKSETNYFQVYTALSEAKLSIISKWENKIRRKILSAHDKPSPVLIHHLPSIVDNLIDIFKNQGTKDENREIENLALNKTHGKQRANETDFSLEEVLKEFWILRETIIEHLYPLVTPELSTAKIIHQFIDLSVESTVLEFERLQNQKISKQRDDLEVEKQLRQRFVAALTHDLRTPLAAASMSAQMIQRKSETDSYQQKYLGKITHNLLRMEQMIQDFLDVTLIKSGQPAPVHYDQFNLNSFVEEVVDDLITIHGSRFQLTQKDNLDVTMGMKSVRRIIENLANNAVKYGSPNGQITIETRREDKYAVISVHNEGSPINPEDIDVLFGHYVRTKSAKESDKKGWGLGLPLVKGLVEAHHGFITVTSSIESGTTFTVQIPVSL